tara:strand:+ start:3706 stop:4326 length:621 start_codon:yes stop_codon:yes gene_type:complete
MAKKCPKGVICIENTTIVFLLALIILSFIFFYNNYSKNLVNNINETKNSYIKKCEKREIATNNNLMDNYRARDNDVLLDPYVPPFKDNVSDLYNHKIKKLPINIKTQNFDTNYSQIGILTRISGKETILPLMGRKLFRNRDKWNYYTMNDKNNMIKLPITFKNKKCMNDQGCDTIYSGDKIYVEGYNDLFNATIYDNNNLEYIPYL